MDERLNGLINNNVDLKPYLEEYHTNSNFLKHYFLQDKTRILENDFYYYNSNLNINDKFELLNAFLNNENIEITNRIINDLMVSYGVDDELTKRINDFIDYLVDLDRTGIIDINNYKGISHLVIRKNPLLAISNDINNIKNLDFVDNDSLYKILDICIKNKFEFNNECISFINENILNNDNSFVYFINNCQYDSNVSYIINQKFNSLSKEELFKIYPKINNSYYINKILSQLNCNNYDVSTIIKNRDFFIEINSNYDKIVDFLGKLADFQANIIIVMPRIDMEYITGLEKILGDKLRISPIENQNVTILSNSDNKYSELSNIPKYTKEYILESEKKLDLYAKTVESYYDKDGDLKSLSPLEKYIAAYMLTIKFAPYRKENLDDKTYSSRAVYEFVNVNANTKIVCAGYVNLLRELLYRMGIKETAYWGVYAKREGDSHFDNHARMMIHLSDPKYNIDGLYMADPTWDSNNLATSYYKHMLLSHDELTKVDPDVTLTDLHADDINRIHQSFPDVNSLIDFNKPIDKDILIKASLAIEHFVDKNMKMLKSGEDYNEIEYQEMAKKMGFNEKIKEPSFDDMINMKRSALEEYFEIFPDLKIEYVIELRDRLKEYFANKGYLLPLTVSYQNIGVSIDPNSLLFKELLNYNEYKFVDGKKPRFIIYNFDDKSFVESLPLIEKKLDEYQKLIDNLSSNKDDNRLK